MSSILNSTRISNHPGWFPVPETDLVVYLSFPAQKMQLDEVGIIYCLTSFQRDLSRKNPDDIILRTQLRQTFNVDVSLTPLSDVSQSAALTYLMAVRVVSALSEYVHWFQLFEKLRFLVLDGRSRQLAFGTLTKHLPAKGDGTEARITPARKSPAAGVLDNVKGVPDAVGSAKL
ncbi:MAG: hypothetical protein Q9217_004907 [Psora testacea]